MKYRDYLQSAAWKRKKREATHWHSKQCAVCGSKKIDIHHRTYRDLPNEDAKYHLVPLCREHHFAAHDYAKELGIHIYHATEKFIKKFARNRPLKWISMTRFEREKFLGKAL